MECVKVLDCHNRIVNSHLPLTIPAIVTLLHSSLLTHTLSSPIIIVKLSDFLDLHKYILQAVKSLYDFPQYFSPSNTSVAMSVMHCKKSPYDPKIYGLYSVFDDTSPVSRMTP